MAYCLRKIALLMLLTPPAAFLAGCGGGPRVASPDRNTLRSAGPVAQNGVASSTVPPGEGAGTAPYAALKEVVIDNFTFSPPKLTVTAGIKVTWVNRDDVPHTATSTSKPRRFDSGALDTDDRFEHVFTVPGTYDYFCAVHPHMTGQIIVK